MHSFRAFPTDVCTAKIQRSRGSGGNGGEGGAKEQVQSQLQAEQIRHERNEAGKISESYPNTGILSGLHLYTMQYIRFIVACRAMRNMIRKDSLFFSGFGIFAPMMFLMSMAGHSLVDASRLVMCTIVDSGGKLFKLVVFNCFP